MKRNLQLLISVFSAAILLTLTLVSLAYARQAPDAEQVVMPPPRPASPASGVYTQYDTLTPADTGNVSYEAIDISASADFVWEMSGDNEDNDISERYPIGFLFPFYDQFYSEFRISENGYILFGEDVGTGTGVPDVIPNNSLSDLAKNDANSFIAPFASDLFGYPGVSRVYIQNDTANRRTIIQFSNMVWCCSQNNPRTFQVILYPSGFVQMQYPRLVGYPGDLDANITQLRVGMESPDGSTGDVYYQTTGGATFNPNDGALWTNNLAIRYERTLDGQAIFGPDIKRVWDDAGRTITTTGDLYLAAAEDVTYTFEISNTALDVTSVLPDENWRTGLTFNDTIPVISGTFTGTLDINALIPITAGINDIVTATFVAEAVGAPTITDSFTLVYGPAHRDLQVQKTLDPDIKPAQGGAFRYRINITNTDFLGSERGGEAREVVVNDLLPLGAIYEGCHVFARYITCEEAGLNVITETVLGRTVLTWTVGTMDVNERDRIYLEMRNISPGGSTISNTASILTYDSFELGFPSRNFESDEFTVDPEAKYQLRMRKELPLGYGPERNIIASGQPVPYVVDFFNNGRQGRIGNVPITVTLQDTLPPFTTLDRVTRGPSYNDPQLTPDIVDGRTIIFNDLVADNGNWNFNRLHIWVTVPTTIPVGTRLTNTAVITSIVGDTATDDVVAIVGSPYVDPFVDKAPSIDTSGNLILPEQGLNYTYWITYANRSVLTDATDVVIKDTLPASVTLVTASPGRFLSGPDVQTVGDITTITWMTDTLPAGASEQLLVVVNVPSDIPKGAEIVNSIDIDYSNSFNPSTNLDDTDVLTLEIASDLSQSSKSVDNATPTAGEEIEYALTVRNRNSSESKAFVVTDTLPSGVSFISNGTPSVGGVVNAPNEVVWSGSLGPNSESTLTIRARVSEMATQGQIIRNTAIIEGDGTIINRSVDVTVSGGVFSGSSKSVTPEAAQPGATVQYSILVNNAGGSSQPITVTDTLPTSMTVVAGSASQPITLSPDNRSFTWSDVIAANDTKRLDFQVKLADDMPEGVAVNVASLQIAGETIPLTATLQVSSNAPNVQGGLFLPIILK